MQNLYENFLHEKFYTRLNYSNRAVIYGDHTKYFYMKIFITKIFCTKIKQIMVANSQIEEESGTLVTLPLGL